MGKQVAAGSEKKNRQEAFYIERASADANPDQQGSAVIITGFTSDQRIKGILFSDG